VNAMMKWAGVEQHKRCGMQHAAASRSACCSQDATVQLQLPAACWHSAAVLCDHGCLLLVLQHAYMHSKHWLPQPDPGDAVR
jgi:hypothetical protein